MVTISNFSILFNFWNFCKIYIYYKKKLKLIISYQFLFKIFFIVFIIVFLLPIVFYKTDIINNFYSPLSRLWQFILGSLSYLIIKLPRNYFFKFFEKYNLISFCLILYIFWQINIFELNYFNISLITSISTFFIIVTLHYNFSNIFLRSNILIFSGKISYPLILLHVPVFYFFNLYFVNQIIIIIGTFVISYSISSLIYKIKFNISQENFPKYKNVINFIIFCVFILSITSSVIYFKYKQEITKKENFILNNIKNNYNYNKKLKRKLFENSKNQLNAKELIGLDANNCFNNSDSLKNYTFNQNGALQKIYFIGGSNAANLSANISDFFVDLDHPYTSVTYATCFYIQGYNKVDKFTNKIDDLCNSYNLKKIKDDILKNDDSIIILSSRFQLAYHGNYFDDGEGNIEGKIWRYTFTPSENKSLNINLLDNLYKDILKLSEKNKIVLIYPFPEFAVNTIKIKTIKPKSIISSSYSSYIKRSQDIIEVFEKIKSKNIYRIFPDKIFCNKIIDKRCISSSEDAIYFEDASHLTKEGIKLINNEIIKTYNDIINEKFY